MNTVTTAVTTALELRAKCWAHGMTLQHLSGGGTDMLIARQNSHEAIGVGSTEQEAVADCISDMERRFDITL